MYLTTQVIYLCLATLAVSEFPSMTFQPLPPMKSFSAMQQSMGNQNQFQFQSQGQSAATGNAEADSGQVSSNQHSGTYTGAQGSTSNAGSTGGCSGANCKIGGAAQLNGGGQMQSQQSGLGLSGFMSQSQGMFGGMIPIGAVGSQKQNSAGSTADNNSVNYGASSSGNQNMAPGYGSSSSPSQTGSASGNNGYQSAGTGSVGYTTTVNNGAGGNDLNVAIIKDTAGAPSQSSSHNVAPGQTLTVADQGYSSVVQNGASGSSGNAGDAYNSPVQITSDYYQTSQTPSLYVETTSTYYYQTTQTTQVPTTTEPYNIPVDYTTTVAYEVPTTYAQATTAYAPAPTTTTTTYAPVDTTTVYYQPTHSPTTTASVYAPAGAINVGYDGPSTGQTANQNSGFSYTDKLDSAYAAAQGTGGQNNNAFQAIRGALISGQTAIQTQSNKQAQFQIGGTAVGQATGTGNVTSAQNTLGSTNQQGGKVASSSSGQGIGTGLSIDGAAQASAQGQSMSQNALKSQTGGKVVVLADGTQCLMGGNSAQEINSLEQSSGQSQGNGASQGKATVGEGVGASNQNSNVESTDHGTLVSSSSGSMAAGRGGVRAGGSAVSSGQQAGQSQKATEIKSAQGTMKACPPNAATLQAPSNNAVVPASRILNNY